MGVPGQKTIDFKSYPIDLKSCTNNDKDLTHKITTQKTKSQFPDYVKPFLKQYICLLGFNQEFGNLIKDLDIKKVRRGILKKRENFIDRLYNYIKRYGEAVKSGFFKDLSGEELPQDVFVDVENIERKLDNFWVIYFVPYIIIDDEYGDAYEDGYGYPVRYTLSKNKYEDNVDKDYPGLRKLVDTLGFYYETIKYEKIYFQPELEVNSYNSESEYEYESGHESEDEQVNQEISDLLDNATVSVNIAASDSDISDFDSDSDSDGDSDIVFISGDVSNYDTDSDSDSDSN